tara:strand:+ start:253 stop:471 length:219 start_codon:yes stop_codon:yes gene_type:complete
VLENETSSLNDLPKEAIIAPTIITEEIALVTDIRGVCKEGVTLQITKYPIKIESTNMLNLKINGSISTATPF